MKRKSSHTSAKTDDARLLTTVFFIGLAILVTVFAVFKASRMVSNATDFNYTGLLACGMKCNPQENTCPQSAPYCVSAKPGRSNYPIFRCSQDPNVVTCVLPNPTTFPSTYPTGWPTVHPTAYMTPYPTFYLNPTCPPPYLDRADIPCAMP